MKVYLDNAATTKVDDRVFEEMQRYSLKDYGNASSVHVYGTEAKKALEKARKIIAGAINANTREIYFTSSGTEANNWALKGLFFSFKEKGKNHIITTKIEHDCVLNAAKWLESQGAKVTYLDVDKEGFVNLDELRKAINEKTFLVSIIHGNNEIGTIQDLEAIGKICKEKGVLLHSDACQSFTKVGINVKKMNIDLLTLNAHKIHGPKGVGALYVKEGIEITPLLHGGGQEKGMRSSTENIAGIAAFGKAVEVASEKDMKRIEKLREKLMSGILEIEKTRINGSRVKRLCNNVNITIEGVDAEAVGGYLENAGIYISMGSACMSNSNAKSHVLKALGFSDKELESSMRLSLSKYTTEEEIDYTIETLKKVVGKLRKFSW